MLKAPPLEGWRLFGWLAVLSSAVVIWPAVSLDLADGKSVLSLIRYSVRVSLPFFLLAYVASAWYRLQPHRWSRWLLSNRRMFGLLFAFCMGWQAVFIALLYRADPNLFRELVLAPQFLLVDGLGYAFILTMTVTSFEFARRRLSTRAWRLLHLSGMTYLWLVLAGTYVYAAVLGGLQFAPVAAAFLLAFALRVASLRRKAIRARTPTNER